MRDFADLACLLDLAGDLDLAANLAGLLDLGEDFVRDAHVRRVPVRVPELVAAALSRVEPLHLVGVLRADTTNDTIR